MGDVLSYGVALELAVMFPGLPPLRSVQPPATHARAH